MRSAIANHLPSKKSLEIQVPGVSTIRKKDFKSKISSKYSVLEM